MKSEIEAPIEGEKTRHRALIILSSSCSSGDDEDPDEEQDVAAAAVSVEDFSREDIRGFFSVFAQK